MFRDLITLLAFAVFFFVLHVLVLENKERVERDGHGIPVIGIFLAWLSPILDEFYEAVIGRRLRGHNKNKEAGNLKRVARSARKETPRLSPDELADQQVDEEVSKVPTIGSQSKQRTYSTATATSIDGTDQRKHVRTHKKKRQSSRRRSTHEAMTSEDGGQPVDGSRDAKKKTKKRRSKCNKTAETSFGENVGMAEESVDKKKEKKSDVLPGRSEQKHKYTLQESLSDGAGGYLSESSVDKKRGVRKEAPISTKYSQMMQRKQASHDSEDSNEKFKPPAKNSIDHKTDESSLIALPKKAFQSLRNSFKKKKGVKQQHQ